MSDKDIFNNQKPAHRVKVRKRKLSDFVKDLEVKIKELEYPEISDDERINKALEIAWQYSQIGGEHHKTWSIDQMVRALCGDEETYKKWVEKYEKPLSDEPGDYYVWDEGIAP